MRLCLNKNQLAKCWHIEKENAVMTHGAVLPEKSGQVTEVKKPAMVSDLPWGLIYQTLGLMERFRDFVSSDQWKSRGEEIGRWSLLGIRGVSIDSLTLAHRSHGWGIRMFNPTARRGKDRPMVHTRDPENGSYQIDVNRCLASDRDLWGQSAKSVNARGIKGCTLIEYLLLSLALRSTRQQILDCAGTVTICSGSRMGNLVPIVEHDTIQKRTLIVWVSENYFGPTSAVREVFDPLF
jgi:hypothetical protein